MAEHEANGNGRRDFQRILISVLTAAWGVLVLAGAGWIGSIQSQVNSNALTNASQSERLAGLEIKNDYVRAEIAAIRTLTAQHERELIELRANTSGRR